MSDLLVAHYHTTGLPPAQAFAEWRALMAPIFHVERARYTRTQPRGSVSTYVLGDVIMNRATFNAQHLTRSRELIAATPHHLMLQFYRSGGFDGTLGDKLVTIGRGQVAVCDLAQTIDARTARSDTIGLAIPRPLLAGIDLDRLTPRLDRGRERRLAERMTALHRVLPGLRAEDGAALGADLCAFLRNLLAVEAGPEPDGDEDGLPAEDGPADLVTRAERIIRTGSATMDVTPSALAEELGVSRPTLYRAFAPQGGVMRFVREQRLLAVEAALVDPLEERPLSDLAAAYGFGSLPVLSRSFRIRFGLAPREFRDRILDASRNRRTDSPEPLQRVWTLLGHTAGG